MASVPLRPQTPFDFFVYLVIRLFFVVVLALPYQPRVRIAGWVACYIFGPLGGANGRISKNLTLVLPHLDAAERRAIARQSKTNIGRTMMEIFSPAELAHRAADIEPTGSGWEALKSARDTGRAAIIISGHFGNWDVMRHLLKLHGMETAAIYRPANNAYFEPMYARGLGSAGGPMFPRGNKGARAILQHLKAGKFLAILLDQSTRRSPAFDFMGQPAHTSPAAMEFALKYDAVVVACYAKRRDDGFSFDVTFEPPLAHTEPMAMTQALADSLAAQVRAAPGQWFWAHQRWKTFED